MPSRVMTLTMDPTYYSASAQGSPPPPYANVALAPDDKENVDPCEPGRHHRDALLLRPAESTMASRMQLYSHLNGKANSPKDSKPNPNPKPISAKPRRRRYPLQDITAIVYPGSGRQVNIHTTSATSSYGNNSTTHIPFPSRRPPPYQHAPPRHNGEGKKREALVLSPFKKQATINFKAKKHFGNPCLEKTGGGERAEQAGKVQDSISISISTESEKRDTIIKKALDIRRRQLRRATNMH